MKRIFLSGLRSMIPIAPGIVPFGAVMGTVCADAKLTLTQCALMNIFVFAGSSQLAALDLMGRNAPVVVVVVTGLVINLRFLLYSAAISPVLKPLPPLTKLSAAYFLTDQSYAVMLANERKLTDARSKAVFYFGAALSMVLIWHSSVISGFIFGNFAPAEWNLDYAIPLSFITLMVPTLKNRKHVLVAVFSSALSILVMKAPYNLGLIITAISGVALGLWLSRGTSRD